MLNAFYLITIILGVAIQGIVKKPYTQKTGSNGVYIFSAMMSAVALLFFAVTATSFRFDWSFVPYSVAFAASYAAALVFMVLAVANGSLALSSLFVSYSLMIPTLYGLFVLHDPIGLGLIIGLILLCISLFLVNKTNENAKISFKWVVFATLSLIGNGMCTVVQKMQQLASGGAYKNEFMMVALAIVCACMLVMSLSCERRYLLSSARCGWHLAVLCGAMNGIVNLFTMILSGRMAVSLMFPLISVGGLVITYLVSKFWYKETLCATQTWGFLLGLAAVVCLNL